MLADIEDISMTTSCSKYEEKVIDDQNEILTVKGAHFGVKADNVAVAQANHQLYP